ncbi:MAG: NADH-quinone oxidoreductase subunit M, partial [Gammaproteobacteria bacterium]
MSSLPLLSAAIWIPILFGLALLVMANDRHVQRVRVVALVGAVLGFLVTLPLYTGFQAGSAAIQFEEFTPWVSALAVNY